MNVKNITANAEQDDVIKIAILPITEDNLCPFLQKDLNCAIYKDRPEICRKFGDESHWALRCPMQHKDGTVRNEEDKIDLTTKLHEWMQHI